MGVLDADVRAAACKTGTTNHDRRGRHLVGEMDPFDGWLLSAPRIGATFGSVLSSRSIRWLAGCGWPVLNDVVVVVVVRGGWPGRFLSAHLLHKLSRLFIEFWSCGRNPGN